MKIGLTLWRAIWKFLACSQACFSKVSSPLTWRDESHIVEDTPVYFEQDRFIWRDNRAWHIDATGRL
jgi:hypothetical protein